MFMRSPMSSITPLFRKFRVFTEADRAPHLLTGKTKTKTSQTLDFGAVIQAKIVFQKPGR